MEDFGGSVGGDGGKFLDFFDPVILIQECHIGYVFDCMGTVAMAWTGSASFVSIDVDGRICNDGPVSTLGHILWFGYKNGVVIQFSSP